MFARPVRSDFAISASLVCAMAALIVILERTKKGFLWIPLEPNQTRIPTFVNEINLLFFKHFRSINIPRHFQVVFVRFLFLFCVGALSSYLTECPVSFG